MFKSFWKTLYKCSNESIHSSPEGYLKQKKKGHWKIRKNIRIWQIEIFIYLVGNTWTTDHCSGERALDDGGQYQAFLYFLVFLTEAIPLCNNNNNCTIYYILYTILNTIYYILYTMLYSTIYYRIPSVHNNINKAI